MQIIAGGVPLGEDFYKGRIESVDELRSKIVKNDVLLIGPRRTGKTSVIKEFLRQENENNKDFYCIFIDLEKAQDLYEFYFLILKAIYQTCRKWKLLLNDGKDFLKSVSNLGAEIFEGKIDPSAILGMPEGASVSIKFPKFDISEQDKLKILSTKLHDELRNIKEEITIVLDEFPELIWKFGQTEKEELQLESRKIQTQFLLESLRSIRQEDETRSKRVIIAGSVNLPNTLKHLGLEHTINDIDRLNIPYLTPAQSFDLMSQLIEGNELDIKDMSFFESTILNQVGICSPYYIQIFAECLIQLTIDRGGILEFSNNDIKLCYKNALIGEKGPTYLLERIKRYYLKNSEKVEHVLEIVSKEQFHNKKYLPEKKVNSSLQSLGMNRRQISALMAKMKSDDLIQFLEDGEVIGFRSQILCNFWNYTFIDTEYWYDA